MQLRLIRALLPEDGNGFFGIGDPDQAIYGFRGASGQSEDSLRALWPSLRVCRLGQSYRASQGVLDMAQSLLQGRGHCGALQAMRREQARLHLFSAPDQQAEARWIAGRIRQLLGATAHTLMDQIAQEDELAGTLSPGDVAVLVRLKAQIPVIRRALEQEGIPCAAPAQEDCWQDPLCAAVLRLAIARGQGEAPVPAGTGAGSGPGCAPARSPGPAGPPFRAQPPARPALAGHGLEAALPCMAGLRPVGGPCAAAGPAT